LKVKKEISDQYLLGQSSTEQERLRQQAASFADDSNWLFDQIGVAVGSRVADIGCGPQGCLDLLSRRVGPNGSVVGVEMDGDAVTTARRFLADHGICNVEVRQGDGKATGLPRESFDLATARLVLVNIPEPERVVAEMMALVKPGGAVALHEADWGGHLMDPPLPACERLLKAFDAYATANGIDLYIGRRVPRILRAAGLVDVQVKALIHEFRPGHPNRSLFVQFARNLRERFLSQGFISEAELTDSITRLERHLEDPATLFIACTHIQAWGRKKA
jgi:ubiquinone/menaquinone biosynthesis C-methylase UbiE